MKFCANCGTEIATKDGENLCAACDRAEANDNQRRLARRRQLLSEHARTVNHLDRCQECQAQARKLLGRLSGLRSAAKLTPEERAYKARLAALARRRPTQ